MCTLAIGYTYTCSLLYELIEVYYTWYVNMNPDQIVCLDSTL